MFLRLVVLFHLLTNIGWNNLFLGGGFAGCSKASCQIFVWRCLINTVRRFMTRTDVPTELVLSRQVFDTGDLQMKLLTVPLLRLPTKLIGLSGNSLLKSELYNIPKIIKLLFSTEFTHSTFGTLSSLSSWSAATHLGLGSSGTYCTSLSISTSKIFQNNRALQLASAQQVQRTAFSWRTYSH